MDVTETYNSPPPARQHRTAPTLRAAIAEALRANGLRVEEQVACTAGVADIAAADRSVIYEVKHRLTRKALQQATGQLMLYRQAINPAARAVVIGYATEETASL